MKREEYKRSPEKKLHGCEAIEQKAIAEFYRAAAALKIKACRQGQRFDCSQSVIVLLNFI